MNFLHGITCQVELTFSGDKTAFHITIYSDRHTLVWKKVVIFDIISELCDMVHVFFPLVM